MSSEPLSTATTTENAAASGERGLLVAMLLMVLFGTTAMLFMS